MDRPRALLSVWEKEGIVEFASSLNDMGWTIISTGGTSKKLREANIISENEVAYRNGDLIVAENLQTKSIRVLQGVESLITESNRRILKG